MLGGKIDGGVQAEATVIDTPGGMLAHLPFCQTVVELVVLVPDRPPYSFGHRCNLSLKRYPIPGDVLSLVVDPADPYHVSIDWDQLQTIDERIENDDPVFTDPESAHKRVLEARQSIVDASYAQQDQALGSGQAAIVKRAREIAGVTTAAAAEAHARELLGASPVADGTRPTARVVADTAHGATPRPQTYEWQGWGELLLSVAVPGKARYGARHRGRVHATKDLSGDVPVRVDDDDPRKAEILWDELPDVMDQALHGLEAGLAEAKASIAAAPQQGWDYLSGMMADPAVRAQMVANMQKLGISEAEGMAQMEQMVASHGAAPAPAPPPQPAPESAAVAAPSGEPIDDLQRLRDLRDSGVLTDAEFAAEKARLLDRT